MEHIPRLSEVLYVGMCRKIGTPTEVAIRSSGCVGSVEFDEAHCLANFPWPKLLGSWVDRCQRHTWPPVPVLEKILKTECHCMPIGSKVNMASDELEWRLSFSQAEQQLNNMFINKVEDDARESLLQQLYQYYRMGVSCLLLSPTLRSILEPALCRPSFMLSPAEGEFISVADLVMCGMLEILSKDFSAQHIWESYIYLKSMNTLSQLSISSYQLLTLQYCTAQTLVRLAFLMANSTSCCTQKTIYNSDTIICGMLKMAARLGYVSHLLYLAMYYYRTGRYDKTVRIMYLARQGLSQSFIIYGTFDRQRYNEAVGNMSLSRRMKKTWVNDVELSVNIPCIEELCLEQFVSQQNGETFLIVSPFVMVEMLSVLSHYRLGNISQSLQSLTDLQTLLLYDDGRYVPLYLRDISWQILGICQQVVGDINGALESYEESLRQEPYSKIKEAADFRIECIKQQLQRTINM
ncbi:uncharacterized protein LOC134274250 [Saccostrea cucullata]|uniref:uncharacterized protein LOC134274250 n=1 Tax=Saccostrea cuccullata TaxID=36930 RepID=UPI002ED2D798